MPDPKEIPNSPEPRDMILLEVGKNHDSGSRVKGQGKTNGHSSRVSVPTTNGRRESHRILKIKYTIEATSDKHRNDLY